jgi:hypothetical protein
MINNKYIGKWYESAYPPNHPLWSTAHTVDCHDVSGTPNPNEAGVFRVLGNGGGYKG